MDKSGYNTVCLVLVLATFSQFGLGSAQLIGSIHVTNKASQDMDTMSTLLFDDGRVQTDSYDQRLPKDMYHEANITTGMACLDTSYRMVTNKGLYVQINYDWCKQNMAVDCLPDCYWVVDDAGFSVADTNWAPQTFVVGWNGPEPLK